MTKKNYTKKRFKSREEWLEGRKIGGSSASQITGHSKWGTKFTLWCRLMGNEPNNSAPTESMVYGTMSEDIIRKMVALDLQDKYEVKAPKGIEMYSRKDKPYMTATIDGTLVDKNTGKKGVLEIKTHDVRGLMDEEEWNDGNLPNNYYAQVCHYLLVLNDYDFAILTAKLRWKDYETGEILKEEIRFYRFDRDAENVAQSIAYLEREETCFWEENILKRKPPVVSIGS